ncbi:MAG: hypothetical protein EXS36_11895 [Pedosphaera sp.]|nr:hypothetical protein [Pedosphaera sp.]
MNLMPSLFRVWRWLFGAMGVIVLWGSGMMVAASLRWHWSNPRPFGNNIADLTWRSNGVYVAVADHGQLFTSGDLATWHARETGTPLALRAVTYLGNRLVVVGEAGVVIWADTPDSLNHGSLGTRDWLEGIVSINGLAVAVGDHGAVYTTPNGQSWTRQPAGITNWLRSVTWGRGLFCAVGEFGFAATSPDGTNWIRRTTSVTNHLNRVTWVDTGFLAVGENGRALLSDPAGSAWRDSKTGTTNHLNAAAIDNAPQGMLIAGDNALRLYFPPVWNDELNTNRTARPAFGIPYLALLWKGTEMILGGRTGALYRGCRSGFGFNWVSDFPEERPWLFDLAARSAFGTNITPIFVQGSIQFTTNATTNTFYSAVGEGATLLESDDGRTWQSAAAPDYLGSPPVFLGVGGHDSLLVAVGSGGNLAYSTVGYQPVVRTNLVPVSPGPGQPTNFVPVVVTNLVNTFGLDWNKAPTLPVLTNYQGVCATTGLFVITGAGGTILTSPTGTNQWTIRNTPRRTFLSSVVAFPGGFVAVGDGGVVVTSTDGVKWVDRSPSGIEWIYRIRWVGDQLVAVGQGGRILTSTDAAIWTARVSGTPLWLNDVVRVNNTLYAVGVQGIVLASFDSGVTWSALEIPTGKSLYAAATHSGQLVVAGVEGIVLRAQSGDWPQAVRFLNYPRNPSENLFQFIGSQDQRFRLDRGAVVDSWTDGPEFEITDPDGILLFFDPTPNAEAEQWFRSVTVP